MAISLFDASIPNYLQTLDAVDRILAKGLAHCSEHGIDPQQIVETRLHDDMLPFRFQIQSVAHHSSGAVTAMLEGSFAPPARSTSEDYAALQALVKRAHNRLENLTADTINAREGAEVVFRVGDYSATYTVENFLMSFSLPNFHFHAATTYDILRMKGVPLGKRDFMGKMRAKA